MQLDWDWFWLGVTAALICLPPKWDPAFRLKKWIGEGGRKKRLFRCSQGPLSGRMIPYHGEEFRIDSFDNIQPFTGWGNYVLHEDSQGGLYYRWMGGPPFERPRITI